MGQSRSVGVSRNTVLIGLLCLRPIEPEFRARYRGLLAARPPIAPALARTRVASRRPPSSSGISARLHGGPHPNRAVRYSGRSATLALHPAGGTPRARAKTRSRFTADEFQ